MKNAHVDLGNRGFIKGLTVIVVGVCLVFIFLMVFAQYFKPSSLAIPSGGSYIETTTNPLLDFGDSGNYGSYTPDYGRGVPNTDGTDSSSYKGKIHLSSGNASYSIQPYEEYITIRNGGSTSVDITGWTLTNGKGTRPIQTSQNNYVYPVADSATIGQGTEFLDPSGVFALGDIILKPNDTAVITTGGPYSQYAFSIYTSFRENICVGYLENFPFTPSISLACPYPANDALIRTVTDECYDYMTSLSRCKNPETKDKKKFELQTTQCQNFMKARLNYPSCVANNKNSSSFSTNQWRVFLGKKNQLWASTRETITLYDKAGNIVDQLSY